MTFIQSEVLMKNLVPLPRFKGYWDIGLSTGTYLVAKRIKYFDDVFTYMSLI